MEKYFWNSETDMRVPKKLSLNANVQISIFHTYSSDDHVQHRTTELYLYTVC